MGTMNGIKEVLKPVVDKPKEIPSRPVKKAIEDSEKDDKLKITTEIKMISELDPTKNYVFELKTKGVNGTIARARLNAFRHALKDSGIQGIVIPEDHLKSINLDD